MSINYMYKHNLTKRCVKKKKGPKNVKKYLFFNFVKLCIHHAEFITLRLSGCFRQPVFLDIV